jgi:hypothetical protein
VRWRYDPAMAGVSGSSPIAASTRCTWPVSSPAIRWKSSPPISPRLHRKPRAGRRRHGQFPHVGGTVGRLWTSSVAIGRQHGFDIQVFGETGGLRWASEQPNQVFYTPVGGRTQIMEKGRSGIVGGGRAAQPGGDWFDHPAGKQPRFGMPVRGVSMVATTRSMEASMISAMGWRIVVRLMFCQPAISMSLSPMRPMSSGTEAPRPSNRAERAHGQDIVAAEIGLCRVLA